MHAGELGAQLQAGTGIFAGLDDETGPASQGLGDDVDDAILLAAAEAAGDVLDRPPPGTGSGGRGQASGGRGRGRGRGRGKKAQPARVRCVGLEAGDAWGISIFGV